MNSIVPQLQVFVIYDMRYFGGGGQNRTDDRGFADLGLTTWLRLQNLVNLKDQPYSRKY